MCNTRNWTGNQVIMRTMRKETFLAKIKKLTKNKPNESICEKVNKLICMCVSGIRAK